MTLACLSHQWTLLSRQFGYFILPCHMLLNHFGYLVTQPNQFPLHPGVLLKDGAQIVIPRHVHDRNLWLSHFQLSFINYWKWLGQIWRRFEIHSHNIGLEINVSNCWSAVSVLLLAPWMSSSRRSWWCVLANYWSPDTGRSPRSCVLCPNSTDFSNCWNQLPWQLRTAVRRSSFSQQSACTTLDSIGNTFCGFRRRGESRSSHRIRWFHLFCFREENTLANFITGFPPTMIQFVTQSPRGFLPLISLLISKAQQCHRAILRLITCQQLCLCDFLTYAGFNSTTPIRSTDLLDNA